ncbi:MAG: amidohydrolase family protein [Alphaproteobacteria bacterium]|nr:amidohydrolase family protein [Alphaproteobacteria bacterium]
MTIYVRCGQLFTGQDGAAIEQGVLVIDGSGVLTYAGPRTGAPPQGQPCDTVLDYAGLFIMPGLVDVHTHLSYGNAKNQEDINLSQPLEFRALRGLYFAQQVLAAGVTSLCSPGDAGLVGVAIRDAIAAGLFDGPRVTAAGRYITTRQSLTDWYPTWVGVPQTSTGVLVGNRDEAIEEIRRQVKDGVDCVKIALDGVLTRPDGEIVAAFTQAETTAMVEEIHRLGKKVVVHARGREATLYAARAGVDLINHAFYLDDACIEAMLKSGSAIAPTLTFPYNIAALSRPSDPVAQRGGAAGAAREFETACHNLRRAKAAGIPLLTGSDSGFAVTPYGEWHARELTIFVDHLGYTPAQALRAATEVSSSFTAQSGKIGALVPGRLADFIAVEGSPLEDVSILLDKRRVRHVHVAGREIRILPRRYDPSKVSDMALVNWNDVYTQARVELLSHHSPQSEAAQ